MSLVILTSNGPVRTLTLNAPERRNALDWPLLDEIAAAVHTVATDTEARALIVTGAGKAFCAGADLANLFGDLDRPADEMRSQLLKVYASFLGLRDLTIPTIAAVQGVTVGAGLNIALACDLIIAGPQAAFGPTFAEIGLHPGGGCTWMLTQRIGQARTLAALYSGAIIGVEEAMDLGIATARADDALAFALELAHTFAARPPKLMADIKRSVQIAATSDLATSLEFESQAQAASTANPQFRRFMEGFAAAD